MNIKNSFLLFFLFSFGYVTQERCAQSAIAQTCATSRSLLTNGFNAWMANRDTLNYIGLGLFCTCALGYAWSLSHYFENSKLVKTAIQSGDPYRHSNKFQSYGKSVDFFHKCLYSIAFSWLALSLKPEAFLGVITSYLVWQQNPYNQMPLYV